MYIKECAMPPGHFELIGIKTIETINALQVYNDVLKLVGFETNSKNCQILFDWIQRS